MPSAARVADPVSHALPPVLTGGPGSPNVSIGGMPAWRALPSALGAAIEAASQAMDTLMGATLLTPMPYRASSALPPRRIRAGTFS